MKRVDGTISSTEGILASGVHCGLKEKELDLGILYSEVGSSFAATFTTNKIKAAPVLRGIRQLQQVGTLRAVVANSGCANAFTGERGEADAEATAREAARRLDIRPEEVLVASTGEIGKFLDMEAVKKGIEEGVSNLSPTGGGDFAKAILTTDTTTKEVCMKIELTEGEITIAGCAKGAGMISPNMATMLAFVTTDLKISNEKLRPLLRRAVDATFNRITVDGHTSTNDTVLVMANGASGVSLYHPHDETLFADGLTMVCRQLARRIVEDGEGATKFVTVVVEGARTQQEASTIARAIANSPLVKCAIHGADPNWGRIVSAAGAAGPPLDLNRLFLKIGPHTVISEGRPVDFDRNAAKKYLEGKNIKITLRVGQTHTAAEIWTCDMSEEYVKINAEYTT